MNADDRTPFPDTLEKNRMKRMISDLLADAASVAGCIGFVMFAATRFAAYF